MNEVRQTRWPKVLKALLILLAIILLFFIGMIIKTYFFSAFGEVTEVNNDAYTFKVYETPFNASEYIQQEAGREMNGELFDSLNNNFSEKATIRIDVRQFGAMVSEVAGNAEERTSAQNLLNITKDKDEEVLLYNEMYNAIYVVPTDKARAGSIKFKHFKLDYIANVIPKTGVFFITKTSNQGFLERIYNEFKYTFNLDYKLD